MAQPPRVRVLVLNAGSSTLKASVLDHPDRTPRYQTTIDWGADATRETGRSEGIASLLDMLAARGLAPETFACVGHRVVHGGEAYVRPVIVDDDVLHRLGELADLAPLHNPVAIDTILAAMDALPAVPHVAAFDTAFHATLPRAARHYPLPWAWIAAHGIRRYGFHGLSVEWATLRTAELLAARPEQLSLVVAHLGSGCSVTAVDGGRSAWTSMGMTPLEGLMMGTRAGSVDPGILLRLLDAGVDTAELADGLDHRSGLLGVAGSADMRALLAREAAGDEQAMLALEMFVRRAAEAMAAAATALPRVDALVFTGGIGENAEPIRDRIVSRLVGVGLRAPVHVVEAREDLVIAAAAAELAAGR